MTLIYSIILILFIEKSISFLFPQINESEKYIITYNSTEIIIKGDIFLNNDYKNLSYYLQLPIKFKNLTDIHNIFPCKILNITNLSCNISQLNTFYRKILQKNTIYENYCEYLLYIKGYEDIYSHPIRIIYIDNLVITNVNLKNDLVYKKYYISNKYFISDKIEYNLLVTNSIYRFYIIFDDDQKENIKLIEYAYKVSVINQDNNLNLNINNHFIDNLYYIDYTTSFSIKKDFYIFDNYLFSKIFISLDEIKINLIKQEFLYGIYDINNNQFLLSVESNIKNLISIEKELFYNSFLFLLKSKSNNDLILTNSFKIAYSTENSDIYHVLFRNILIPYGEYCMGIVIGSIRDLKENCLVLNFNQVESAHIKSLCDETDISIFIYNGLYTINTNREFLISQQRSFLDLLMYYDKIASSQEIISYLEDNKNINNIKCIYQSDILDINNKPYVYIENVIDINMINSSIRCNIPEYIYENNYIEYTLYIKILINEYIQENTIQKIRILPNNKIFIIVPSLIHDNGNSKIVIKGNNFISRETTNTLTCKFVIEGIDKEFEVESFPIVRSNEVICNTSDFSQFIFKDNTKIFVYLSQLYKSVYQIDNYYSIFCSPSPNITSVISNNPYMHISNLIHIQGVNFIYYSTLSLRLENRYYDDYFYIKRPYSSVDITPIVKDRENILFHSPLVWRLNTILTSSNDLSTRIYILISLNSIDYIQTNTFIDLLYPPIIESITPNTAFQYLTTEITVQGNYFTKKLKFCVFSNQKKYKTELTFKSNTTLSCNSPLVDSFTIITSFSLESEEGIEFTYKRLTFLFIQTVYLSQKSINPDRSDISGNIKVLFQFDFDQDLYILSDAGNDFKIYFGNKESFNYEFDYKNKTITVTNPPFEYQTDVNVIIRLYDQIVNRNIIKFYYYSYKSTSIMVTPLLGPISGGTIVNVRLINNEIFNKDVLYKCKFKFKENYNFYPNPVLLNEKTVYASLIDSYNLNCISPQLEVGVYEFNIFYDDIYLTNTNIDYIYYDFLQVISISPSIISLNSKCILQFIVRNVVDSPNLRVILNNTLIKKENITIKPKSLLESIIEIDSVVIEKEGNVEYSISNNNQDYSTAFSKTIYAYDYQKIIFHDIYPKYIPYSRKGKIYITGDNLIYDKELYVSIDNMLIPVKLSYKNNTKVLYFEYPYENTIDSNISDSFTSKTIKFTYNRCDYWEISDRIIFYSMIAVTSISQTIIEEYKKTTIIIYGNNIYNFNEIYFKMKLSFIDESNENIKYDIDYYTTNPSYGVYIQRCTYININKFKCTIPQSIPYGKYFIQFTQNMIDFSESQEILIIKNSILTNINPKIISNLYNSWILLSGFNFYNLKKINIDSQLRCLFEPSYDYINKESLVFNQYLYPSFQFSSFQQSYIFISNGYVLSNNLIKCSLPSAIEFRNFGNMEFKVRIKLDNNLPFSSNFIILFMLQDIPSGYTTVPETGKLVKCPQGHYCNSLLYLQTSSSYVEKICPSGYYSPNEGDYLCRPCEIGFSCINSTTIKPSSRKGTETIEKGSSSDTPCPAGTFCSGIVYLSSQDLVIGEYKYKTISKESCKLGTFCRSGTVYGIVNELNNQTARLCQLGNICPPGSMTQYGSGECPSGHYCPHQKDYGIECPTKYFCPNRGNIYPILCPEGTYSNTKANKKCIDCSQGFFCPYKGMFEPYPCFPGYVCEHDKVSSVYQECDAGRICTGGNIIRSIKPICELRDFKNECSEVLYDRYDLTSSLLSNDLYTFLNYNSTVHKYLCCMRSIDLEYFFDEADMYFNNKTTLNQYKSSIIYEMRTYKYKLQTGRINKEKIRGFNLLPYVYNEDFDFIFSLLDINIPLHQEFLKYYFRGMFNNLNSSKNENLLQPIEFQPKICPRKYYCLRGTATNITDKYISNPDYSPQSCLQGTYCMDGAYSKIGTNLCPPGYNCPKNSDQPSLSITQTLESKDNTKINKIETSCYAGYFTTGDYSNLCLTCPDGYQCDNQGTSWPMICPEGTYRSKLNKCIGCPKGTYSLQKGTKDILDCIPCPSGTVCSEVEISSFDSNKIKLCSDGFYCKEATGMSESFQCPVGYYCPKGTKEDTIYNNPCEEGYLCEKGTGENNKRQLKCPKLIYCPKGTTLKEIVTICPIGTGQDKFTGLIGLQDCIPALDKIIINNYKISYDNQSASTNLKLSRLLQISNMKIIPDKIINNKRHLQEEDTLTNQSKDKNNNTLYNNHFELVNSINLVDLEFNKFNSIKYDFNYNDNVKPVFSINPLRLSPGLKPTIQQSIKFNLLNQELSSSEEMKENYYYIQNNTYALITFDWRHLYYNDRFLYGIDWEIAFYQYRLGDNNLSEDEAINKFNENLSKNQTFCSDKVYCLNYKKLEMSEIFLNRTNNKSSVHEFIYYTTENTFLKVLINFYNGLYVSFYSSFINSGIIENFKPNRVKLNSTLFYFIQIKDSSISFPVNLPMIDKYSDSNDELYNRINKSYLSYNNKISLLEIQNEIRLGRNSFKPSSLYWNKANFLNIPYLPFFSNCEGYGRYIFLWALLEQNNDCNLVKEEDTEYLSDTRFGKSANGDTCSISLNCIYDESYESSVEYWFNSPPGTELFSITLEGKSIEDNSQQFNDEDKFIVTVDNENEVVDNGYPRIVNLNIFYYQTDSKTKRIVKIEFTYSYDDIIKQTDLKDNNIFSKQIPKYTLNINYKPYDHTELMKEFALSYTFYIALYCVQGLAAVIIIFFFLIYTIFMSRIYPKPKLRFLTYFPLTLPPLLVGFLSAMVPIWIIAITICFLMTGNLIKLKFGLCYQSKTDCYKSIFDGISYFPDPEKDELQIGRGRVGLALSVVGLYLFLRSTGLMTPKEKLFHQVSFDLNFWRFFSWKKANFYFLFIIAFGFWIYFTYLSYSNLWGSNIWVMIYSYKILGIIYENIIEESIGDKLLKSHIPLIWSINQNLFTFGADNLIDFLTTYFVELASMMLERTYIEIVVDWLIEKIPEKYIELKEYINKILQFNINLEEDDKKDEKVAVKQDENILGGDNLIEINSSSEEENESDEFENDLMEVKNDEKIQIGNEKIEKNNKNDKKTDSINSDDFIDEDIRTENVELVIEKTTEYCSELFGYFFNFYLLAIIWVFYYETGIFQGYNIKIQNFIYFWLFTIVIIPFNVISDYLFQNLIEFYDGTPIHDYYDFIRWRFSTRKYSWALDEVKTNYALNKSSRTIEKLCFSSQFYFLLTLSVSGSFFIQMGVVTLILQKHNIFGDVASILIVVMMILICYIIDELTILIGRLIGFWRIELIQNKDKEKNPTADDKVIDKTHYYKKEEEVNKDFRFPALKKNWDKVENFKKQEEILEMNLRTERLVLDSFRQKFLNENRRWIQNLIGDVLTPRTLLNNKEIILNTLEAKFGYRSPDLTENSVEVSKSSSEFNNVENINEISFSNEEIKKAQYEKYKEYLMMKCKRNNTNAPFEILAIWKNKAKLSLQLFDMLKLIILSRKKSSCIKCGTNYLLRTYCAESIITIFERYLKDTNQTYTNFDKSGFRKFFNINADIVTICSICDE